MFWKFFLGGRGVTHQLPAILQAFTAARVVGGGGFETLPSYYYCMLTLRGAICDFTCQ